MAHRILAAALLISMSLPGCERASDDAKVVGVLTATIEALEKADWPTLWANSAPTVQNDLLAFHRKLAGARERVRQTYRAEARVEALELLGASLLADLPLDGDEAGPRLLERLFERGVLRIEERIARLARSTAVTVSDERAVLHSTTGQVYNFVLTTQGWRSMLLSHLLDNAIIMTRLRESMTAFERRIDEDQRRWRQLTDPTEPQGAINLARIAALHAPVDVETLWALLDAHAREALRSAFSLLQDLRSRLAKTMSRRARRAELEKRALSKLADAKDPEDLFRLWCESSTFRPPIGSGEYPATMATPPAQGFSVVSLTSGRPVQLSATATGTWQIVGVEAILQAALVAPLQRVLNEIGDAP